MKTIRLLAAMTAALFLSARSLPSQCTHTTVHAVGASIKPFGAQDCWGGIPITMHGLTLRLGHCPVFAVVMPPHNKPMPEPGCGTDTVVAARPPVEVVRFRCKGMDFLLFEIRWCHAEPPVVAGNVEDFGVQACR